MYESLNTRAVSIGSLLFWVGIALGFTLLAASQLTHHSDLGRWAFAILLVSCTYSIHRHIEARDDRLRQAFELGRQHEQQSSLTAVH